MVQVREQLQRDAEGNLDVVAWIGTLPGFHSEDAIRRMLTASEMSRRVQPSSGSADMPAGKIGCFDAGVEMVGILADLHMDENCLIAALIYRAVREGRVSQDEVVDHLGDEASGLVQGVLQMAAISNLQPDADPVLGQGFAQVENIREMLVAMVDDVRVALIKLAERTQAIRAVKNHPDPEKQIRVAREVFDVYAPLAHRLGIGQIKWELEDISFRYLQSDAYMDIARQLDGKRLDRQRYIDEVVSLLKTELAVAGVDAEVHGRAKHIYSIWRKMQRKSVDFDQVYDVRALRVMVPELRDCYASLGVVHTLWRNIPYEFDDYIANPKDNGYRSLHTAVVGPGGKVVEVQIRTQAMHEEAELGVCAHWLYKGTDNKKKAEGYEQKLGWLRQVLEWHDESSVLPDLDEITQELMSTDFGLERIYVFTPEGHVVDVAAGSTPVDFAYHIHTEVGHRCRGAKVDGRIVPLNTPLHNGQKVEILTGPKEAPNRDWLRLSLGYIHSGRARSKIRAWFRKQARGKNVEAGRALIERELKRLAFTSVDFKLLAECLQYKQVDDLYAALGAGDIPARRVLSAAEALLTTAPEPVVIGKSSSRKASAPIAVLGINNLLSQFAGCCKPLPGDDIGGYVTVNRGVTVHRKDCKHYLQLQAKQPERLIEVFWGQQKNDRFPVDIGIEAYDRTGLLNDISAVLAAMHVNVISMNTQTDPRSSTAKLSFTIEVQRIDELARLLARINNIPNVIEAERLG